MNKKRFFFRDKESSGNFESNQYKGTEYHAQGIVMSIESELPSESGKDLAVYFIHPFQLVLLYCWRSYEDIELFEVSEYEWQTAKDSYCKFRDSFN
jgi:hypothetical protein